MRLRTAGSAILVNYAGYPSALNSLTADNGLASLAGGLKGHRRLVLDYATTSTVKRLVPPFISTRLGQVLAKAKTSPLAAFAELKVLSPILDAIRRQEEIKIAAEIAAEVEERQADVVGFKLWNGDGFTGAVRMAGYLKERFPQLTIAAGGPQAKFFKDFIFSVTHNFDVLAIGDGEPTINPLIEAALTGDFDLVPNIYYRRNSQVVFTGLENVSNMDSLPLPAYDAATYPALFSGEKIKTIIVIEDGRGCKYLCHFCAHPVISGPVLRNKSAARIADEFAAGIAAGFSAVRLGGSSTPASLLHAIGAELEQRGIKADWTAFARISDSRPDDFPYLKRNGLFGLFFGIESGDPKVLAGMNKKISPERIETVITAAKAAGLFTVGSIIYPAPFDTPLTRQRTLDLLTRLRPDSVPILFMGIYPGTEYGNNPERYGFEITYPSLASRLLQWVGLKPKARFYSPEVQRYLLNYKLNLLFPPKYWEPLPWKLNGLAYKEYAAETQRFYEELRARGIMTVPDDMALMAKLGGYDCREFADEAFQAIFTGNAAQLSEMVRRINRGGII
jgi:anaerobic magnesium-protoporphyrin IX monomethyl ester cyclase